MPLEETHWLPRNHLEVLEGHPERGKTSVIRRIFYPLTWGLCTLSGGLIGLLAARRPLWAGVPYTAAATLFATAAGEFYGKSKEKFLQEEEARLRYYIASHPEHFPDYDMVKIGDVLEPWFPVR